MSLTAFRMDLNMFLSRYPILLTRRFVSITRICERSACAFCPATLPTDGRSGWRLVDVVRGIATNVRALRIRSTRTGLRYSLSEPSCSKPTLTPKVHHHICRSWQKGASERWSIFFLFLFQPSKSFAIRAIVLQPINRFFGVFLQIGVGFAERFGAEEAVGGGEG